MYMIKQTPVLQAKGIRHVGCNVLEMAKNDLGKAKGNMPKAES